MGTAACGGKGLKGGRKWRQAKWRRQPQTATQPGVMPTPPPPSGGHLWAPWSPSAHGLLLQSWKQNDWKLRNGRPVWNRDLWEELAGLLESRPQQTVLWRPAITTQLMSRIMQDILSRSTVAMLGDATDRVPVSIIGA